MKKQFLGIVAITMILLGGATFAQDLEYSYCSPDSNGSFVCQEYQSCNNPDGYCSCTVNSLLIPHNTTCLKNTTSIKNRVVSSFAVSGSIVTLKFSVKNTSALPRFFDIRLPEEYKTTKIKVLEASSDGLYNGALLAFQNGIANPRYLLLGGTTKNIVITGQVVSSTFAFDPIKTSACLRNITSSSCIEEPMTWILPTTNYSITQKLFDPQPIFSGEQILYEISITNNGSKTSTEVVNLTSLLGNFLGTASLTYQQNTLTSTETNNNKYIWNLGNISAGETKTYLLSAPLISTPIAGSLILTTGSITAGNELLLSDNITSTLYTLPTIVDISFDSLQKISEEPEATGEILGFSVTYGNKGNTNAQNIRLTATISGTNQSSIISLPDLAPQTSNSVVVTGMINGNYPVGTRFCFSGTIVANNETETGNNNSLSGMCYTLVKSADLAVEANLVNELASINSGSLLSYTIKVSNKGEKTANNVTLALYPSSNQIPQTPVLITGITLSGGEEKTIFYTGLLYNYPPQGTTITLSGTISFAGIDLDATNNSFALSNVLAGLPDLYIHHSMFPFSGFKTNDTITYIITYGNSGYAQASNPVINFTLPSSIAASQSSWNLGSSLAAGATGSIVVTGTLKEFLAAGTAFGSEARISTASAEVTIGNNLSSITGTVPAYDNISFGIDLQNITRPNTQSPMIAVSGDTIKITINYANNGNVPATANITITNLGALSLDSYASNLGTIGAGQQGTLTINGRIAYKNFINITPTVTISYNTTGVVSRTFAITEPYLCGDGLLTRDEVCEPNGLGVINTGEQVCENQQGICRLVTKRISNTACVQPLNGPETCSNAAVITLKDPSCYQLDITSNNNNSTNVTARCFGQYTSSYTPVTISCGNGTSWTGLAGTAGMFAANCSYNSTGEANSARLSCSVGNNTTQSCTTSVLSCDLDVDSQVVILDEDEEKGTVDVECSTRNGSPATLQINCGNGKKTYTDTDNIMRHTCSYDQSDFEDDDVTKNITCSVNGSVSCSSEVILDQGIIGICGDGIRQGYEQCDLEENNQTIWRYLDEHGRLADSDDRGKVCSNCSIEDKAPAQCLSVHNGNISIEKGEYLPFWWKINTQSFANSANCSDASNKGKIIKGSINCEFEIQRPSEEGHQKTQTIYDKECAFFGTYPWTNYEIFKSFMTYMKPNTWAYAVNTQESEIFNFIGDNLGEYKLRLKEIKYDYCNNDGEKDSSKTDNVCETNFTITKPYLVQKSVFGMTPKSTTIDLSDFYDINKNKIITRTDLADVMLLDANEYTNTNINSMIDSFVSAAEKLAVSTTLPPGLRGEGVTAKKVPNKDIYILIGGSSVTLRKDAKVTKPFTLIVKDASLIIDGNIDVNGMFVVKNGTIKFTADSCAGQQIVKGIFVAKYFDGTKKSNTSLYQPWCNAGGLYVKGVLIGGGIENLVTKKRSNLSQWFKVSGSERSVQTQRRNMIFNGASVLIEYSPDLWQQLPPGADQFTKELEVYKK